MTLRSRSPQRKRNVIGQVFIRRDLRRALLMTCCLVTASSVALFSQLSPQPERQGEFEFGRQTRVGSIQFIPARGDICRQSAFDNDSGRIWPILTAPCVEIEGSSVQIAMDNATGSKVAVISEGFRK